MYLPGLSFFQAPWAPADQTLCNSDHALFFLTDVILPMHSHFLEHLLSSPGQLLLSLQDFAQMCFLYKAFPEPDASELDQLIILYTWPGFLGNNSSCNCNSLSPGRTGGSSRTHRVESEPSTMTWLKKTLNTLLFQFPLILMFVKN